MSEKHEPPRLFLSLVTFHSSLLCWRRGWDLNPRWSFPHSGFRDRCTKPLCDLSKTDVRSQSSDVSKTGIALNPEVNLSFDIRLRAPRAKKLLHDLSALLLKHAGCNINPVIQKIRITDSKSRFNCTGPLVTRAIHQPFYARLYQSACTHHTWFNCRINHRASETVVINAARRSSQRYDFRMCRRILIRSRSVSGNGEYRSSDNNTSADGNLATLSRLIRRGESPTHPTRVRVSFPGSSHDRNISRQITEN
jgi:hypothetical protein